MNKSQTGLTLIELLIGMSVLAVLLSIAVPSFQTLREQHTVRSAGMAIYADLQLARSEAIKRNKDITVCFTGSGTANWNYQIKDSTDCSGADIETTSSADFPAMTLTFPYTELTFKPRRHNLDTGTILVSGGAETMKIITASTGRIRTCSDDALMGVPSC